MTAITAGMVKELRELSGAGMLDCKKALEETGGNMEAAMDWLRAKGIAKAAKKSSRTAAEGLVGAATNGTVGALVEINSETDFVARNDEFQTLVADVAALALKTDGDVEALKAAALPSAGKSVAEHIADKVAKIGENMTLRRSARLSVGQGFVASYVHNAVAPGMGKIGVLCALESSADRAALEVLGKQICMHIAATNPASLSEADLDPALVERERAVLTEQAASSGKPAAVVEKMIEGRIRKYYEEVCLLKQAFVMNPDLTVEKAVAEAAKAAGQPISVKAFVRLAVGEGIQKEVDDFAAEVAKQAGLA